MFFLKPNVDKLRKKRDHKALGQVIRNSRLPEALRFDAIRALANLDHVKSFSTSTGSEASLLLREIARDVSLPLPIRTNAALAVGQIVFQQQEKDGFIERPQAPSLRFLVEVVNTLNLGDGVRGIPDKALAIAVEELHRLNSSLKSGVSVVPGISRDDLVKVLATSENRMIADVLKEKPSSRRG